jgi:intracellular multiplication protein IcmO
MSEVKLSGVDAIKFDDQAAGGNLGMAKDMRPFSMKYKRILSTSVPLCISFILLILGVAFPGLIEILCLSSIVSLVIWRRTRAKYNNTRKALFDNPKYANYTSEYKKRAEDFKPKEGGEGLYFFGHELNTEQELHASDDKARTHIIIFGTTGSGKTECILSICVNFMAQASGYVLVDGKGDSLLFAKSFALCKAFGRLDDLYLLNFMDQGVPEGTKRVETITNTFNFFVDATPSEANEIVGGLLPSDEGGGSGMWEGRATTTIQALNQSLYWLKDNGYIEIDPDVYRTYFGLDAAAELAMNEDIPQKFRAGLWSVLTSINYKPPPEKQNSTTEEQWQFIAMQFTETFNMLAEKYSHITVSQVPDISMTDIVLRRRILLVLLPSLSQSPNSVRNLGRIVIAMTRNVSAKALGSKVEGNYETVIESKPTAAVSSYGLIFDEFGTYATKGASTLPAQVRSLNLVCVFAGQDYEAFKRGDEIEAATIFANCTLKLCLKLECNLTYEKFKETAGEMVVVSQESFETKDTMFGRKYIPAESARVERRPVLDLKDLKAQKPGWGTMIFGSQTFRLKMFYADPIMPKLNRLNHFLEIKAPDYTDVMTMQKGVNGLHLGFKQYLNGDWKKKLDEVGYMTSALSRTSELNAFAEIVGKVVERTSKHETEIATPFEQVTFSVAVFLNKLELLDKSVARAVRKSTASHNDFDDDALLSEFDDEESDPMGDVYPSQIPEQVALSKPKEAEPIDDAIIFSELEKNIREKQAKLEILEQESFAALPEMGLDVFRLEVQLASLETALIEKHQKNVVSNTKRYGELAAKNLVADMSIKSNPANNSQSNKSKGGAKMSNKQVKNFMKDMLKQVGS